MAAAARIQAGHTSYRGAVGTLVGLLCLLPLGMMADDGIGRINEVRAPNDIFAADFRLWRCVQRSLNATLPRGARFFVPSTSDFLISQRLGELSQPDFVMLPAAEPGAYRVDLIPITGQSRPDDCPPWRLTAAVAQ